MIRCKICDKLFRQITNTHLKTHGITTEEYKKKYGVKYLYCKSLRKRHSKLMEGNDYAKGYEWTDEQMKNHNGKYIIPNGHTKGRIKSKRERREISKRLKKKWKDPIYRKKMLKVLENRSGHCKQYKIKNHIGEIEKVRGSFEKRVGRALTKLGIRWEKYKRIEKGFPYKLHGKIKRYYPDFYLKDNRYYLETKNYIGKDNFEMIIAKQKMMIKRGGRKRFQYEIMFDKDIKKLEREAKRNEK